MKLRKIYRERKGIVTQNREGQAMYHDGMKRDIDQYEGIDRGKNQTGKQARECSRDKSVRQWIMLGRDQKDNE